MLAGHSPPPPNGATVCRVLQACFAVPTIIVPSSVLRPPLLQPFLAVLQQHLQLAGVQGTRLPSDELLQQQFVTHLHAARAPSSFCGSAGSNASAGSALLTEACIWLPPKPQPGSAGAVGGSSAAAADASLLPLPTRALLEVLHDWLATHLARPGPRLQYSRVAGQLHTAYARRVKDLLAQGAAVHHPSHSHHFGTLVLEALEALRHSEHGEHSS